MAENKAVSLTAEDLKDVLRTVIEEARKPVVTEQDQRVIDQRQQERAQSVQQLEAERANTEWIQTKICPHRRRDNTPRTVLNNFPANSGGTFMVCQKCQAVIRPSDEKGTRFEGGVIYSTDIFNSLMVDQSAVMD